MTLIAEVVVLTRQWWTQACEISTQEEKFLCHIISDKGVKSDSAKTSAVREIYVAQCESGLHIAGGSTFQERRNAFIILILSMR